MVRHSIKTGLSFGLTSGIITTLGLMVGLDAGTHSKLVVIGGILTIAIADAFSDALGIHISEESENKHTAREIWESTISTFLFKFFVALTFLVPVFLFELQTAVIVGACWGIFLLGMLSIKIASEQKTKSWKVVVEHLVIALVVIAISYHVGSWVSVAFR